MDNKVSKNTSFNFKYLLLAVIFLIVLIPDQLLKNLILQDPSIFNSIKFGSIFEIILSRNYYLSFLYFIAISPLLYFIITLLVIFFFYRYIYLTLRSNDKNKDNLLLNTASSLIIAGAMGNLIDRVRFGYVIDYLHLKWPIDTIFNLSDVSILLGSLLLVYKILREKT